MLLWSNVGFLSSGRRVVLSDYTLVCDVDANPWEVPN